MRGTNMTGIRQTELTHPLVQSFSGARSALEDVFQHYKMGRYGEAFPEKPYFLLSRCTHVFFSLWLAEQESEQGFFGTAAPPAAFALDLDFGELRYSEYKRRMLQEDGFEEHLRNETKWFEFWMRILEQFDKSNTPAYQKFCQDLLMWAREPGFLEGKVDRAHRKALRAFLRGDEAGRALTGTMRLLEDLLRAIVGCYTTPGTGTGVVEPMILLAGLLGEMRRIIVWETPAQGPCVPFGKTRWRNPSPWQRLLRGRTPGSLTVVPKREGGEIICTFQPAADSAGRPASWVRPMTSLADTYEAELFATWSYDSGAYQEHPDQFPGLPACWTVQNAEAGRLEILSKHIDSLLEVLQRDPVCTRLAAAVGGVSRNDAAQWQAVALPWTYVNQLDQLVGKLTFVCREARAVGTEDAARGIVERVWPSGKAATEGGDPHSTQNSQDRKKPRVSPSVPAAESAPRPPAQAPSGTLASLLQRLGGGQTPPARNLASEPQGTLMSPERQAETTGAERASPASLEPADAICSVPQGDAVAPGVSEMPEPQRGSTPQPSAGQPSGMKGEQESERLPPSAHTDHKDSEAKSESGVSEPATDAKQPDSADAGGSPQSVATDSERAAAPVPRAARRQQSTSGTRTKDTDRPSDLEQALLRRLREHHEQPDGTINCEPLSSAELQHDLSWSLSNVQRAMTKVFGPKPANAYRSKCKNRTIGTFLKARAGGEKTRRAPVRAKPQKAGKARGASTKRNPRRKSHRRPSA
jgi:hypothetical protein